MREALDQQQYNFKIILLGDSGAGLSSKKWKYIQKKFNEIKILTLGVDFLVKDLEISGQKTRLNIQDTAGKERFKSVNKSYY